MQYQQLSSDRWLTDYYPGQAALYVVLGPRPLTASMAEIQERGLPEGYRKLQLAEWRELTGRGPLYRVASASVGGWLLAVALVVGLVGLLWATGLITLPN